MLNREISDPCPHKIFLLWKDLSLKLRNQGSLSCPCKESYRVGGGTALTQVRKDWTWFFFFSCEGIQLKFPSLSLKQTMLLGGAPSHLCHLSFFKGKNTHSRLKRLHMRMCCEYDVREHLWHTLTPEPSLWANWTALLSKGYRILLWV